MRIKFNTGRLYTQEGQVIHATLHDDNESVTFMDHSRKIDGEFKLREGELFCRKTIMEYYDHGRFESTHRSRADGMYQGGSNV